MLPSDIALWLMPVSSRADSARSQSAPVLSTECIWSARELLLLLRNHITRPYRRRGQTEQELVGEENDDSARAPLKIRGGSVSRTCQVVDLASFNERLQKVCIRCIRENILCFTWFCQRAL